MYLTPEQIDAALTKGFAVTQCPNKGTSLEHSRFKEYRIWNIRDGWQTAIEEGKVMGHHKTFPTFEEAIERDFQEK